VRKGPEGGFTLIEMLVVVVVIGILAAVAIPNYSRMREKTFVAAVTSDLKNMASLQEVYHGNNQVYTNDTDQLGMTVSKGVIISINEADGTGWSATGAHSALMPAQCGIYFGSGTAANATPATSPGVVLCSG
jgi:prepilin-type N-terminal cleavage/methylation domain-containing protein